MLFLLWIFVFVKLEGKLVKLLMVVNSMLIVISENLIMVGDKNGFVFLIVLMVLVWLCDLLLECLNRIFDFEKSVFN